MSQVEIQKECFAFKNTDVDGCKILHSLECKKRVCPFFKTKEQIEEENEKVEKMGLRCGKITPEGVYEI